MTEELRLTCSDCGQEFTFSSEDQAFFQERGYSAPKRCKACRQAKKNEQAGGGAYYRSGSKGTTVTCSGCGKQTTVPFEPRGDRPVYCQDCYNAEKRSGSSREITGKAVVIDPRSMRSLTARSMYRRRNTDISPRFHDTSGLPIIRPESVVSNWVRMIGW